MKSYIHLMKLAGMAGAGDGVRLYPCLAAEQLLPGVAAATMGLAAVYRDDTATLLKRN